MRRIAAARVCRHAALLALGFSLAACGGGSEPPAVATVEVSPAQASPQVGETVQLSATVKDANGNILSGHSVSWSSSASAIASVSNAGLVTAHALGQAMITAAAGNQSDIATITVMPEPIASISVAPTNDTLLVGETLQLVPTMRDADNNVVTGRQPNWTTSSAAVASVSSSGLVTGVGDGTATITASADGKSATATIHVIDQCTIAFAIPITVGQTVNGSLASTDCALLDDTFVDIYAIQVTAATNVQIDMTASFDTWLWLLELESDTLALRAFNDDVEPDVNTNSQIIFMLQPGVEYFILANSFDPLVTGNYQLSVVAASPFTISASISGKRGKAPVAELLKTLKRKPIRE
jgi:hypothetical protein